MAKVRLHNYGVIAQAKGGGNHFRTKITIAESSRQAIEIFEIDVPDFEVIELKRLEPIDYGKVN